MRTRDKRQSSDVIRLPSIGTVGAPVAHPSHG